MKSFVVVNPPLLFPPYQQSSGKSAAVACADERCTRIGLDAVRKGGNAADAMVATQLCLGVVGMCVYPQFRYFANAVFEAMWLTGIGGGGFVLIRSPKRKYEFVDFRETAPAAAFEEMYSTNIESSLYGGLASGIPGELRGLEWLHNSYGRLPWAELVYPSVDLASNGFVVTTDLGMNMNRLGPHSFLSEDPNWAVDFAPNGTLLVVGDIMTRKRYGLFLRQIAEGGAAAFYDGTIANNIIDALQSANGTMALEDFKDYTVKVRDPAEITYRGFRIVTCSAPSSGVVVLSVFKTVEGYAEFGSEATLNLDIHRLDEAIRFGYGARAYLGDPSFFSNLTQYQRDMISEETGGTIKNKIFDAHTLPVDAYNPEGLESLETPGTSHVVTADGSGLTLSLTSTINLVFGSQLMVPELGLIMNNEMNDFSVPGKSNAFGYLPSPSNFIAPGKRPLSSMVPTIVEYLNNGTLYFAVGAAGGSRIITAVIQALFNVLDRGMVLTEALNASRFHDQLSPNQMFFEYSYNNDTTASMQLKGHNVSWFGDLRWADFRWSSIAEAVGRDAEGTFQAVADPRSSNGGGLAL
ncbi:Glutathione hydrolase proenzyme [Lachnellula suecica]|uniref:Glutathione hydrolase n=1 Tax=Lachnellula suecica TaxID=602035 RepID=A0A8T9C6U9_9HELO|nr:Glutathione hydrolase proenzyme [Lachnellula suecica]